MTVCFCFLTRPTLTVELDERMRRFFFNDEPISLYH